MLEHNPTNIYDKSDIVIDNEMGKMINTPFQLYDFEKFGTKWKNWDEFNKWHELVPELTSHHELIDFNRIYKHHEVGHQRFAWLARTNPKILNIFKQIWNTDELVTGFDGCCYYPKDYVGQEKYWTHSDQSSRKKGVYCYQSFVSLNNN